MPFVDDQLDLIPIAVGIAAIVALIAVILGFAFRRKASKSTILLLGISDAGKTALFTKLCYGKKSNTVTSMKENEGTWTVDKKSLEIVDIPGHERVRIRYTDFLPVTRAIVFVVDSTTVARQVRAVAEYLYNVLAHNRVQRERIPVLIACNKTDMITALPKEKVKLRLEAEIQQLRSTRTTAVEEQETTDDDQGEVFLGFEGEDFTFDQLDNEVSFESCSVEKANLGAIEDWILSN